jgi:calmodulin-regulated spectrin-associated protein
VFEFDPDTERVERLCGNGPKTITKDMLDKVYKYSSGQKKFTCIYAKQFSVSIDAFTIQNHLWQSAKSKGAARPRPMTVYN